MENYLRRSKGNRIAVRRYKGPEQAAASALKQATACRMGIMYDFGFDFHGTRQFCSKFVYEVYHEATGKELNLEE